MGCSKANALGSGKFLGKSFRSDKPDLHIAIVRMVILTYHKSLYVIQRVDGESNIGI